MHDKREYRRIATDISIRYHGPKLEKRAQEYLEGVAENLGRHGLFVATRHPCPVGTVISIEFQVSGRVLPLRAKALVRWVSKWKKPRGMGLLIIEFEGVEESEFVRWLTELYEQEEVAGKPVIH